MRVTWQTIKKYLIGAWLVCDYLYDNIFRVTTGMPRLSRCQVTKHLYIGSQYNLIGLKKLKALGVTAIVNMRMHAVYDEATHEGVKYLHLPTIDNTPPKLEDLVKGADFIDEEIRNNGAVYVHCRQGLGRGPTMAIAYLLKLSLTYQQAYNVVRNVRIFINLQSSQKKRLKELEAYYRELNKPFLNPQ